MMDESKEDGDDGASGVESRPPEEGDELLELPILELPILELRILELPILELPLLVVDRPAVDDESILSRFPPRPPF